MGKFAPLKRKMDWKGRKVRLRRDASTKSGNRYPSTLVFEVEGIASGLFGFWLRSPTCASCGHSGSIHIDHAGDMELLPHGTEVTPSSWDRLRARVTALRDSSQRIALGPCDPCEDVRSSTLDEVLALMDRLVREGRPCG
jgi:hypothetical protein